MYSYLWGNYFYQKDIIDMIDEVNENRKQRRMKGLIMRTSFAEDLKNKMMGIEEQMEKLLYNSVIDEMDKKNKNKSKK